MAVIRHARNGLVQEVSDRLGNVMVSLGRAEYVTPDPEPEPERSEGLSVRQIRAGLSDGTLDLDDVLDAEQARDEPRKTILELKDN